MANQAFITNSDTNALKKRLHELIEHSEELKFLVGFFYFSGWQELYRALKDRNDLAIKVLVGLEIDYHLGKSMELELPEDKLTSAEKADRLLKSMEKALNAKEMDVQDFYEQVSYFIELLENDQLIIRKTLKPNHAKLYLFNIKEDRQSLVEQKFITGSSNLTRAGILEQNEFNVEISDYGTEEAEAYFDELWKTAIPITEHKERKKDLIELVKNRTQVAPLTPFEAYAMVLKTYVDLMEQKKLSPQVEELLEQRGYTNYQYQKDAVNQAITIINSYDGAVIADVVGLGKSIIASMVAKHLGKRGMIICPPSLIGDDQAKSGWKRYRKDFKLYDWEVRSSGKLERIAEYMQESGDDFDIVIIDEAHRYRNEDTQDYEYLSSICRNKTVLLLTATPFNNTPSDIFSLLKLFIVPGKSKITLDDDLESRFSRYDSLFKNLSYITKYYNSEDPDKRKRAENYYSAIFDKKLIDINKVQRKSSMLAEEVKAVIEPVLIRRNRLDLRKDPAYSQEVKQLSDVKDPHELFYELTKEQSHFYNEVIEDYFAEDGYFKGAIYQPFLYEEKRDTENLDEEGNKAYQQQRNLYGFMRRLLVKRFESSFGSFRQSIKNFERVHRRVLKFIERSGNKYILDRDLIEKVYNEDPEEIEEALKQFEEKLEEEQRPKNDKVYEVDTFELKDQFIGDIKHDLQLMKDLGEQMDSLNLSDKDPKVKELIGQLNKIYNKSTPEGDPARKIIIFTEYADTVEHVYPHLENHFDGQVLRVAGNISKTKAEDILANFDASYKKSKQRNDYKILLTTDKLSEGLNLNRAGAIINYDIPWNPTKVIQRVGRINRIGKKVFQNLHIYNFFPTEHGASVIKSKQIATQKMYLIHNTLGEDVKIFEADESPSPADLFKRVNRNPEDEEEENTLTQIRAEFKKVKRNHPEVMDRVNDFPNRVKTAKAFSDNQLFVCRKKGLGFFIQAIKSLGNEKTEIQYQSIEDALPNIECSPDEPRQELSDYFWDNYETIKLDRPRFKVSKSPHSIEVKALNNLKTALKFYKQELDDLTEFARMVVKDLRDYRTLPKYSLRRLCSDEIDPKDPTTLDAFKHELRYLRGILGKNYLKGIKKRVGDMESEIIISIENRILGKNWE